MKTMTDKDTAAKAAQAEAERKAKVKRANDALFESAKMTREDGTLYGNRPQP